MSDSRAKAKETVVRLFGIPRRPVSGTDAEYNKRFEELVDVIVDAAAEEAVRRINDPLWP